MNFVKHSELIGKHAFLSPSGYHWLRYDEEKLSSVYLNSLAVENGILLHEFAAKAIEYGIKLYDRETTINMFVNDSIDYNMTPEQPLYFSDNCFGTCDAIMFRKGVLRIHDLKTGSTKASMDQLRIYAALFCLEYKQNPNDIHEIILSIYQNDSVTTEVQDPKEIEWIMKEIKKKDKIIESLKIKG